jgi:rhodanese-related sulfurtransferase
MNANTEQAFAPTRVTVEEVLTRLDRGEPIVFVDCRNPQAWANSDSKLPGALRVPSDQVDAHLSELPRDRTIITYCT